MTGNVLTHVDPQHVETSNLAVSVVRSQLRAADWLRIDAGTGAIGYVAAWTGALFIEAMVVRSNLLMVTLLCRCERHFVTIFSCLIALFVPEIGTVTRKLA